MTLINYIYLPKSIQKVNKGVLSLYKGRGRTKRGERTKRGSTVYHNLSRAAGQISMLSTNLVFTVKNEN